MFTFLLLFLLLCFNMKLNIMEGWSVMFNLLKKGSFILVVMVVFNVTFVNAIHQLATEHVNLPILNGASTVAGRSYKEDNSKLQYFMTAQCTNNSSGVDQLVQVQTVRVASYSESSFIDAPKHQRVPLDQNHTTEAEYRLNARVKDRIWNTVKFYGIWEIN